MGPRERTGQHARWPDGPGKWREKTGQAMGNVIGILACYALIVILTMPDNFAMPGDDEDQGI